MLALVLGGSLSFTTAKGCTASFADTVNAAVQTISPVPARSQSATPSSGAGRPASAVPPVRRSIDAARSTARFSIEHIFVARVTGTVPVLGGTVELASDSPIPLRVDATLDGGGIDTGDPDQTAAIRGPDYFETLKFPTWRFVSTKIGATGSTSFAMDGRLTMHGVTRPEHLDVTISGDAAHPHYHALATIDRHTFGMRGARLDPVIGNDAAVTLDIALK